MSKGHLDVPDHACMITCGSDELGSLTQQGWLLWEIREEDVYNHGHSTFEQQRHPTQGYMESVQVQHPPVVLKKLVYVLHRTPETETMRLREELRLAQRSRGRRRPHEGGEGARHRLEVSHRRSDGAARRREAPGRQGPHDARVGRRLREAPRRDRRAEVQRDPRQMTRWICPPHAKGPDK
jgi:hypothetical protein